MQKRKVPCTFKRKNILEIQERIYPLELKAACRKTYKALRSGRPAR
jgi:hypothetical protein